jgi:hypothetical protein
MLVGTMLRLGEHAVTKIHWGNMLLRLRLASLASTRRTQLRLSSIPPLRLQTRGVACLRRHACTTISKFSHARRASALRAAETKKNAKEKNLRWLNLCCRRFSARSSDQTRAPSWLSGFPDLYISRASQPARRGGIQGRRAGGSRHGLRSHERPCPRPPV